MADELELDLWNEEFEDEVVVDDLSSLVVYSRDWTVETVFSQINQGNIDLAPAFQRRNAWNDHKRSKLIESLIARLPVPQIVLAEDLKHKGAFIVIDGKQRLLALSGFLDPKAFPYWDAPVLKNLTTRVDLNGVSMKNLTDIPKLDSDLRQFLNADIRCAVITGYKSEQVLYDIFYRLNSASVPLSSQELRQVLNRGSFSRLIMEETNKTLPLHRIMGLDGPDSRFRDAEILLRYVGIRLRGKEYKGNLSNFLEETLKFGNDNWAAEEINIRDVITEFHNATQLLLEAFPEGKAARKYANGKWENRFNRVLLEVEAYYFAQIGSTTFKAHQHDFVPAFEKYFGQNRAFLESIEATTKTLDRYYTRFSEFEAFVNGFFGLQIDSVPTLTPAERNA